jgi:hypothetical protein
MWQLSFPYTSAAAAAALAACPSPPERDLPPQQRDPLPPHAIAGYSGATAASTQHTHTHTHTHTHKHTHRLGITPAELKAEALRRCGDWHAPIGQLIEATPLQNITG